MGIKTPFYPGGNLGNSGRYVRFVIIIGGRGIRTPLAEAIRPHLVMIGIVSNDFGFSGDIRISLIV